VQVKTGERLKLLYSDREGDVSNVSDLLGFPLITEPRSYLVWLFKKGM
jgi:hypothetical protein